MTDPAILSFLDSVYFDITVILANSESESLKSKAAFEGTDTSKFKDGIDPKPVIKILTLLTDGYLSKLPKTGIDLDQLCYSHLPRIHQKCQISIEPIFGGEMSLTFPRPYWRIFGAASEITQKGLYL